MQQNGKTRWGWLKVMYIWTIVIAGGFGLGIIFTPKTMLKMHNTTCNPVDFGIEGSLFLAFALLSILGLRNPLKFVPILFYQLTYKTIWFIFVVIPLVIAGNLPQEAALTVVIFALTIIGDVIAVPFSNIFAKTAEK